MINTATSFKKRLSAEYYGNSTLNIIIIPLNVLLGSVAQWSRSRPSVKMVHVRLFRFVYVFVFNHIFLLGLFSVILTAGPLQPLEVFAVIVFVVMFT